ncbi:hypothetical protein SBRCBS47491_009777 [Sporothrix bragantina]|uniref:HMG box domain-containing protein n=1 Tax=Sporothrix bragantina TaxID=671064 RepID=A0ABP0D021_9PEZI
MDRAIPSPAPSMRERSPAIFNPLIQNHNAASQPRCSSSPFEVVQLVSRSASRYHTPEPQDFGRHSSPSMAYTQPHQGLQFQYPALQPGEDAGAYEAAHAASTPQLYNLNTPEASPPTAPQQLSGSPGMSSISGPQRATQGMKALAVKGGRVSKTAAPKKKAPSLSASPPMTRKEKPSASKDEGDESVISKPLSILTQEWEMPIVDIEAYVYRTADERHEEVDRGKVPGKVKRAMNAFMLYRKAYQDCAKKYAQKANHQVVSKVCGQSWALESDIVRRQFNDWAVIERDNHRKAHPEYKFTPSKPRKKGKDEFGDDSEGDEGDWDSATRRDPAYRATSRTPMMDPHSAPYGYAYSLGGLPDTQPYPAFHSRHPQHMGNPARHTPNPYDADEYAASGMHYRNAPTGHHHQINNMMYGSTAQQGVGVGMGAAHHPAGPQGFDLSGQHPSQAANIGAAAHHHPHHQQHHPHGHPAGGIGQQIDPSLMSREGVPQYDMSNPVLAGGGLGEGQWQHGTEMYAGQYLADVEESLIQEPHLQYLQADNENWKVNTVNEADEWQGLGGT